MRICALVALAVGLSGCTPWGAKTMTSNCQAWMWMAPGARQVQKHSPDPSYHETLWVSLDACCPQSPEIPAEVSTPGATHPEISPPEGAPMEPVMEPLPKIEDTDRNGASPESRNHKQAVFYENQTSAPNESRPRAKPSDLLGLSDALLDTLLK